MGEKDYYIGKTEERLPSTGKTLKWFLQDQWEKIKKKELSEKDIEQIAMDGLTATGGMQKLFGVGRALAGGVAASQSGRASLPYAQLFVELMRHPQTLFSRLKRLELDTKSDEFVGTVAGVTGPTTIGKVLKDPLGYLQDYLISPGSASLNTEGVRGVVQHENVHVAQRIPFGENFQMADALRTANRAVTKVKGQDLDLYYKVSPIELQAKMFETSFLRFGSDAYRRRFDKTGGRALLDAFNALRSLRKGPNTDKALDIFREAIRWSE